MIKNKKNVISLLIALPLMAGAGYWIWNKYHTADTSANAAKPAPHTASDTLHFDANAPQLTYLHIKAAEAFPEPLLEPLNARITYDDNYTARVYSPISGRVTKIAAEAGQQVKVGDVLLQLDSPDYAQASSDSAKAEADLLRKQQAFERARQLLEIQGMARKDVESAEADWHQAEAEALRAKARLKNLASHTTTTEGQFILRAPLEGTISERQVNAGSEVRPDATSPLFVITNPQHLWAIVDLPEIQLGKIKIGQPVSIEVDAYPNEVFPGRIAVIGGTLDPLTRRIQIRCELEDAKHKLKPEMYARVTPSADSKSNLPRIANSALFTQGVSSFIFVELSPGVLQRRRVSLALQGPEYSYVKEGLHAGERVVTSGALLLNSELSGEN
ncbi:MAG: efflux RND transporter periplasmic adaptor subunit [Nitrosomonadales bacterium]|nr:efflux RND transporter periplasmic adaptor subunit [Nitrosomonadales bacterium]